MSGKNMQANINRLYVIKIAHWFMLTMPVILLFYNASHLSVRHLFIAQAAYSLTIVLLEIPSGYAADRWGRKNTIVIGALFGFLGFLAYSISSAFIVFVLAEIMLGIGQSFISGADTAMLYDTLIAHKKENDYLKIEGRMTSLGNFAEAFAGITGGLLAAISPRLPFIGQACIALIAIPAALGLKEITLSEGKNKVTFRSIVNVFRDVVSKPSQLMIYMLFSSVIGSATLSMAWFAQPFFKVIHLPSALYGVLWTLLNISVAITAFVAFRIERRWGEKNTTLAIGLFTIVAYIALSLTQTYWGLIILFMFYLVRGIATPLLKDSINKRITSDIRASVLSFRNLIIRLFFSAMSPLFGWAADFYSLKTALMLAGTTLAVLIVPLGILLYSWHLKYPEKK
ncbi:MAG TPA: MFS transporter [Bacteroidales bacterium]|nr:MFS transporter [Bacteroidales bacterium]